MAIMAFAIPSHMCQPNQDVITLTKTKCIEEKNNLKIFCKQRRRKEKKKRSKIGLTFARSHQMEKKQKTQLDIISLSALDASLNHCSWFGLLCLTWHFACVCSHFFSVSLSLQIYTIGVSYAIHRRNRFVPKCAGYVQIFCLKK